MHTFKLFSKLFRARMADWLLYALALTALVWFMAPQQVPVSVYKLSLVALAAVVGYWIDRSLFPYARPDVFLQMEKGSDPAEAEANNDAFECTLHAAPDDALLRVMGLCMVRRAIIVAATMLSVGLGA